MIVSTCSSGARVRLLNHPSGFSRDNGIAPLLKDSTASIDDLARGLGAVSLCHPVGERLGYSNFNFMLLGAMLQMDHSCTDHNAARQSGMTALHHMWFGVPVADHMTLLPGFAQTGSLVASASNRVTCPPAS